MDSIRIPRRYRIPDLVNTIGRVTYEQQWDLRYRCFLALYGLNVKDGKAYRSRRIVNSLMQIYSVRILNKSKEELDQICGRVTAGYVVIFDRPMDKATPHDIDEEVSLSLSLSLSHHVFHSGLQGYLRLTGPEYPLDGTSCIRCCPRLFRKDNPHHFFHPHGSIKFNEWGSPIGEVVIPEIDRPGLYGKFLLEDRGPMYRLNKVCCDVINTTCGPVEVTHATFEDAADSFLTIELVEWHGKGDSANVYGRIETSDMRFGGDDRARSVAFDLKRDESVRVRPGQYIPMHRPMTVVPMDSQLKVKVSLFHNDMRSEREVIVEDECFFTAKSAVDMDLPVDSLPPDDLDLPLDEDEDPSSAGESSGEEDQAAHQKWPGLVDSKGISGDWGEIEVKAYWLPCWCLNYAQAETEEA